MPGRGFSLHVGVNSPYPQVAPQLSPLRGCDAAASDMAELSRRGRFADVRLHVRRDETRTQVVREWFARTASAAAAGDLVVFTFAGHGLLATFVDRPSPVAAIVCADGAIGSVTMGEWLAAFRRGVRVVLIVESCYAGGLLADAPRAAADVLLLAATAGHRRAVGATRGERLPPFSRRLMAGCASIDGVPNGYAGWCAAAGGVLDDRWLHDPAIAVQRPFTIDVSADAIVR